jgi:hypothetical protein
VADLRGTHRGSDRHKGTEGINRKGDDWPESPETFDKGVITGATANFFSSAPPKDVVLYYLQALPSLGWKLSSNNSDEDGQKIKFCKAGVSLIVDASPDNQGTKYYLGLVWTKFHRSPTYCAK